MRALLTGVALLLSAGSGAVAPQTAHPCESCRWTPPPSANVIRVRNERDLSDAIERAKSHTTLLLADGTYQLDHAIEIVRSHLVIRGASGDPARVVIQGRGMVDDAVGVALAVSSSDVTIANVTIRRTGYHAVQVRGERGASHVLLHNLRLSDTGQQLVKGSTANNGMYSDAGVLECSVLGYTDHAPSDYTNGIDVLAGRNWIVRDNLFERIRGPREKQYAAGPSILFWAGSSGTVVERNTIVDSFRGIALGLMAQVEGGGRSEHAPDHADGAIRNNVIWNPNPWANEGIEANGSAQVQIDQNVVVTGASALDWSVSLRFPFTTATVRNNVTSRPIALRDGARADQQDNVTDARVDSLADAQRRAGASACVVPSQQP